MSILGWPAAEQKGFVAFFTCGFPPPKHRDRDGCRPTLRANRKCGMVGYMSLWVRFHHRQTQEVLGGNPFHQQPGVIPEPKTAVVGRITDQDTAPSSQAAKDSQPFADHFLTDSLPLKPWKNRDRPKREPHAILSIDLDGREGDVTHDVSVDFGDQRDGQGAGGPQGIDDQVLGLMAIRMIGECGDVDLSNRVVIVGDFRPYRHRTTLG